jgi:hypothetical protein
MTTQMSAQMFAIPVVCTAVGAVLYAGWIGPWDARRTLRSRLRTISRQVRTDQERRLLPPGSDRVDLLQQILRLIAEDPTRWRDRLMNRPLVHSPGSVLTGLAGVTLDRHVRRLEKALTRYRRRVRFTGVRIALDVDDLLTDWRIPQLSDPVVIPRGGSAATSASAGGDRRTGGRADGPAHPGSARALDPATGAPTGSGASSGSRVTLDPDDTLTSTRR